MKVTLTQKRKDLFSKVTLAQSSVYGCTFVLRIKGWVWSKKRADSFGITHIAFGWHRVNRTLLTSKPKAYQILVLGTKPCYSTDIAGSTTCGYGELGSDGFWEHDLPGILDDFVAALHTLGYFKEPK